MRTSIAAIIALVVVGGLWFWLSGRSVDTPPVGEYNSVTYTIDGKPVTLINGKSETDIPSSTSKIITQYFGNAATGDLDGDDQPDVAFLITQTTGGSGTYYYVVVTRALGKEWVGTNAVLLGDRVAPQTTEIKNGRLIVNYADRGPGEPMTVQPSVGKSMYLILQDGVLVSI